MDPDIVNVTPGEEAAAVEPLPEPAAAGAESAGAARRYRWWLDLLPFLVLSVAAFFLFVQRERGDFFSDEADYSLASTFGFEANRWDAPQKPHEPLRLVYLRHFHAPLTADLIGIAHRFGADEQTLRLPFLLAGGMSIGLVFLCGSALFDRRREIGLACALLVLISPAVVRMATHALPWSPIIFELLLMLWSMAEYARSRAPVWIAVVGAALGLLFVTSEMFFVAVPAVAIAAPFLLWTPARDPKQRLGLLKGIAGGAAIFLCIAFAVWPSGLTGGCVRMLSHYVEMRTSESFPVNIGQKVFGVAPKWAYLYWYWNDYRPFFVCYAIGLPALLLLLLARCLPLSSIGLLSLTTMLLIAAHRAHIIGPEYLAHCLPFLTLLGGYVLYLLGTIRRPLILLGIVLLAVPVVRWKPRKDLPGMDARSQVSRWPGAARFLAREWRSGDRIVVGSQPITVARWYMVYQGGVPSIDSQFQTLVVHEPKPAFLDRLRSGFYRYVAVSSMVQDSVDLDPKTQRILRTWTVAWKSDELGTGPSRLIIYRAPQNGQPPVP